MKIVTVVGARPQFIKAAVVSREIRKNNEEIIVHTGQHYDYNMSEIFFKELEIPKPDYNLGVSGGTHGKMTGNMLTGIEEVLLNERPDMMLVYGDTNSTLAGALAAVKLHIPVCHVEAGIRVGSLKNPEEVNRICCDHISTMLLCCTESSVETLRGEGLGEKAKLVGDPMYDAFLYYSEKVEDLPAGNLTGVQGENVDVPDSYNYMTCHREENTQREEQLKEILTAMQHQKDKTIYPVHPRNRKTALKICSENALDKIILTDPVGYLTSIKLTKNAKKIVTDSGGLQREAFFAGVPCVTVLDYVSWPETMVGNCNQLAKADSKDIMDKLERTVDWPKDYHPFGKGNAAVKIEDNIRNIK